MKNILITGGAGYVGAQLTPYLINKGYKVTILDLMIYGENVLNHHPNLKIIKGDIRDQDLLKKIVKGHDSVIHLACISNDPSFELNPKLGKSINLDAFRPLVEISKDNNIKKFFFASSSSVYGIKNEKNVNEKMLTKPLTEYSKSKAECEKILFEYDTNDFTTTILRPATVCGYSKRQRLDVVVNILTNLAYHKREITVFGGNQLRPNIHILDMIKVYSHLLEQPINKIGKQIFNVGYENQKVIDLAHIVKEVIGDDVKIIIKDSDDNRSYHISSQKIKKELGFEPKYSIKDAVIELKNAFDKGLLLNSLKNENYFNIKKMQSINLR